MHEKELRGVVHKPEREHTVIVHLLSTSSFLSELQVHYSPFSPPRHPLR